MSVHEPKLPSLATGTFFILFAGSTRPRQHGGTVWGAFLQRPQNLAQVRRERLKRHRLLPKPCRDSFIAKKLYVVNAGLFPVRQV